MYVVDKNEAQQMFLFSLAKKRLPCKVLNAYIYFVDLEYIYISHVNMTTNNIKQKQDLKKIGTFLRNKWNVFLTRQDDDLLSRAILKTTSSKNKCPNEKHMERLLLYTYELGSVIMEHYRSRCSGRHGKCKRSLYEANKIVIDRLEKRLHTHEWTVVLKTLIVFHRLMKDGGTNFQLSLGSHIGVFNVSNMKDLSDRVYGRSLHRFIQRYAMALEERVKATGTISREAGTVCNIDDIVKWKFYALQEGKNIVSIIDALVAQLKSILSLPFYPSTIDNPVVALAWMFLAQDAKRLVHLLSDSIMYLMDKAESLTKEEQQSLLTSIEKYNDAIEGISNLFERLHSTTPVFGEPAHLRRVPTAKLCETLERESNQE